MIFTYLYISPVFLGMLFVLTFRLKLFHYSSKRVYHKVREEKWGGGVERSECRGQEWRKYLEEIPEDIYKQYRKERLRKNIKINI